ncbi:MAG TPA: hypothetical protein PKY59_20320 [Pyrinomonadaceae bacterium]|nr:hypothetical protein [Pyrinomonadaceae bacterium]
MNKILQFILKNIFIFVFCIPFAVFAQNDSKILIADGTKVVYGRAVYGTDADKIKEKTLSGKLYFADKTPKTVCDEKDYFRIDDSADGFFTTHEFKSNAFIYTDCEPQTKRKFQGIIILQRQNNELTNILSHTVYDFASDVKLQTLNDLNGNFFDELAVFSTPKDEKKVRILEPLKNDLNDLGELPLQTGSVLSASKLYAEKRIGSPVFFEEKLKLNGNQWQIVQNLQEIKLPKSQIANSAKNKRFGIADLAYLTLFIQGFLFIFAVVYPLYYLGKTVFGNEKNETETDEKVIKTQDELPKIQPLNCPACGAGVPLHEEKMSCPHCATVFPVPSEYEEIRIFRNEAAEKLQKAENYWKWASIFSSRWVSFLIILLAFWLIATIPIIYLGRHQIVLSEIFPFLKKAAGFFGLGYFFWIPTLFFIAFLISPKSRKQLPKIEKTESVGKTETSQCSQCGGAVLFDKSSISTVCGYCGVETYRARIAWKIRNLTNQAREKANFSMNEAMRTFQSSVDDIIFTPIVLAFLLVTIPAVFGVIFWILEKLGVSSLIASIEDFFA